MIGCPKPTGMSRNGEYFIQIQFKEKVMFKTKIKLN